MKSLVIVTALLLLNPVPAFRGQERGWHGIIPLVSTRADVENILGSPVKENDSVYGTKKEVISIVYSGGPCKEGRAGAWNVPADTVIRIGIAPKKSLRISDLHIDISKYEKIDHPHISGMLSYVNEEDGITVNTRYENVEMIFYGPTVKDIQLNCSSKSTANGLYTLSHY